MRLKKSNKLNRTPKDAKAFVREFIKNLASKNQRHIEKTQIILKDLGMVAIT
tara:strand:- start:1385 stop:1540 length:156 start_codon:yes stop_codon:yes gene_type:complete